LATFVDVFSCNFFALSLISQVFDLSYLQPALASHVVVAELTLNTDLRSGNILETITRSLATVCQVDVENIRLLVLGNTGLRMAVLPSADFVMETDANVIISQFNNSIHNGVLARTFNRNGLAVGVSDIGLVSSIHLSGALFSSPPSFHSVLFSSFFFHILF
jgi:hypothetical protein